MRPTVFILRLTLTESVPGAPSFKPNKSFRQTALFGRYNLPDLLSGTMWLLILLLGAFHTDYTTAREIQHKNYLLIVENGTLQSIKSTGDLIHIDLSGLKLQKIEEKAFDSLSGVKSLNLSSNELDDLPSSIFSKLTELETLSLADNKIYALKGNIFIGLNNLKSLDISNNSLSSLPKGIFYGLTRSVDIMLEGNYLRSMSTEIFMKPAILESVAKGPPPGWPNLSFVSIKSSQVLDKDVHVKICKTSDNIVELVEELKKDEVLGDCVVVFIQRKLLDLTNLGLKKFRKGWYKLSALTITAIDLRDNDITEITPELLNDLPAGLISIYLGYNKIEIIKKNGVENEHLEYIDLNDNIIATIEEGALELTNLNYIAIGNNRLESLSFARTLPSTTRSLIVDRNIIVEIPEDCLKNLRNLSYINVSYNNVTHLPENTFRGLKELSVVDLFSNKLRTIHPGTFEDQGEMLTLSLGNNSITDINAGFFRGLKKLQQIYLLNNKIQRITKDSFSDLEEELEINLFNNEIEFIEKGSFDGVTVTSLDLGNNKISAIPKGVFDTPTLTSLNLAGNLLTDMNGDSFAGLPYLSHLNLEDNSITSIKKGAAKNLGNVKWLVISNNPIERLENGALYGLKTQNRTTIFMGGSPIKIIQGGVFEDI